MCKTLYRTIQSFARVWRFDRNCIADGIVSGDDLRVTETETVEQSPEALLSLMYDELRRLAAQKMAREAPGQTLQATALVHEAWLRLGGETRLWRNRAHFFAAAAEAMRRILVDR